MEVALRESRRTVGPQTIKSAAPLFDVHYLASTPSSFDRYVSFPLWGVSKLEACGYARWRSEFNEEVQSCRLRNPRHSASVGRALVANSLYNIAAAIPAISLYLNVNAPYPVFSRGMGILRDELQLRNPSVALEGGICLFQPGELLLTFPGQQGKTVDLFYGAQRNLRLGVCDCSEIKCVCRRCGPTLQDYIHIYRLVAFGAALAAPVVIGVPDAEYLEEAARILGSHKIVESGIAYRIIESSEQVKELAMRIASRLGVKVYINSKGCSADVAKAMEAARREIMAYGLSRSISRRDTIGYLAMPLVPRHLFGNRLTLSILPALESRTVRELTKIMPGNRNSYVLFPELPGDGKTAFSSDGYQDQVSRELESVAREDLDVR